MRTSKGIRGLLRLKEYFDAHRFRFILGIVLFGVSRVLEASVFYFLGQGIDIIADAVQVRDQTGTLPALELGNTALMILLVVVVRYTVVTTARAVVRAAGLQISYELRQRLYERLQHQGLRFFNRYSVGDMMTRAIADISLIQRLFSYGVIMLVIMIYAPVVGLAFMLHYSPMLTLLILPPMPLVYFYANGAAQRLSTSSRDVQDRLSDLGAVVQENLSGIRTIQAMVQEDNEIRRFQVHNQAYADAFYEQSRVNSHMTAMMPGLAALSTIIIIGYGGHLVMTGAMTIGAFSAFFAYVGMAIAPFRQAGMILNMFQRAAVATDRLFEVFDLPAEIPDQPNAGAPTQIQGRIDIEHLSFTYPDNARPVLKDIVLHIAQGESITIMGRVGSGKTTLLKLLVRLIDPPPGSILIDGRPSQHYPLAQLRAQLAMVPQDPFLFGEPLKDNITYDEPDRHIEAIWAAAESADLRATISEFPEQMETVVGERGVTLSGGQKQRTTLARGFIREAPVLFLDDCFSAVDTETEEHILSELRRLRANRTTILVSHRVSTARHSDRIVVLDDGRVSELGSHDELLAAGGYYADLERIQREGATADDLERSESL